MSNGVSPAPFSYAYTLDNAGHRTSVAELSGRAASYTYDNIYRLTSETIASDPSGNNGAVNYTYDAVGNRTQVASTLAAVPSGAFGYDADDRLALDTYDANGNTISSGGNTNVYDFENHLIGQGGAVMVYDGDGNRVKKTVAGVTTTYLVADQNPTGYAQVVSETIAGPETNRDFRSYAYGLERISQTRNFFNGQNFTQTSFYVYDGHGSVRALTDPNGNVTDTYDYDAFGNLIHTTATGIPPGSTTVGPTPNEFLFAGEQFDSDLHLYYNRARYLNTTTGRFWTMDAFDGITQDPGSLHKYLYTEQNPADNADPTGNQIDEEIGSLAVGEIEDSIPTAEQAGEVILESPPPAGAPPEVGPPPTIPNTPVPVSFGSLIGRTVVTLTALGLAVSVISDNPLPPTQPRTGDENFLTVYRDASGPRPSDFRVDPSLFSITGFGLSLLQNPQRNQKWIIPFMVTYRGPLVTGTVGVVGDDTFVGFMGSSLPIVYSPPEGGAGHWTLQAPTDPAQQVAYKESLRQYGIATKISANLPIP